MIKLLSVETMDETEGIQHMQALSPQCFQDKKFAHKIPSSLISYSALYISLLGNWENSIKLENFATETPL